MWFTHAKLVWALALTELLQAWQKSKPFSSNQLQSAHSHPAKRHPSRAERQDARHGTFWILKGSHWMGCPNLEGHSRPIRKNPEIEVCYGLLWSVACPNTALEFLCRNTEAVNSQRARCTCSAAPLLRPRSSKIETGPSPVAPPLHTLLPKDPGA